MNLIFIGLGILLILYAVKKIYSNNWSKGISAEIELSATEASPGDEVVLTEIISNEKWLPLPMVNVKIAIDRALIFSDGLENTSVSDKGYKSDVFSLLFYQKITRRIPFTCTKRGYYFIDDMDVVSTDLFMEHVVSVSFPVQKSLTVYPQPLDSDTVDIPYRQILGTILTQRYTLEDPFEFRSIREYQTYDTMKSINWSASAKTGDLKVNVHEHTARQEICILLNLEDEGIWEYEELKEKSISMACSLACRLSLQGVSVSIISNGVDKITNQEIRIPGGSDESHRKNILLTLSRIDLTKKGKDFASLLRESIKTSASGVLSPDIVPTGSMPILISSSRKEALQKEYLNIASAYPNTLWILPFLPGMDSNLEHVGDCNIFKWEV